MNARKRLLRRGGMAGLVAAAATAFAVTVAQSAYATVVYTEGFEGTAPGWSFASGTSIDGTVANSGTHSVKVSPACCSSSVSASRTFNDALGSAQTTVTFAFKADNLYGDVDTDFSVDLDHGSVTFELTGGVSPNNGLNLYSNGSSRIGFGSWSTAGTWYTGTITFNAVTHQVTASMNGNSATLSYASNATTITAIRMNGVRWSSFGYDYHYDDIQIAST